MASWFIWFILLLEKMRVPFFGRVKFVHLKRTPFFIRYFLTYRWQYGSNFRWICRHFWSYRWWQMILFPRKTITRRFWCVWWQYKSIGSNVLHEIELSATSSAVVWYISTTPTKTVSEDGHFSLVWKRETNSRSLLSIPNARNVLIKLDLYGCQQPDTWSDYS